MIVAMYANLTHCSNCKDDCMSHDQNVLSGAIMSVALSDDESNRKTESLE